MKNEKSERKFDFRPMGLAIKKAREKKGMTQEQLADIIGRDTRTVMYHENDGQHPSLDIFYQLATMFNLSVDEYFYPAMEPTKPQRSGSTFSSILSAKASFDSSRDYQRNHRKPWNGGSVRNGAASVFSRSFRGSALAASKASVLTLAISALRKCLLGCPQTRWTSGHRDQKKHCLRRRP